jgi:hypothetical protein
MNNSYPMGRDGLFFNEQITPLVLEWLFMQICDLNGMQEINIPVDKLCEMMTKLGRYTIPSDFRIGDGQ